MFPNEDLLVKGTSTCNPEKKTVDRDLCDSHFFWLPWSAHWSLIEWNPRSFTPHWLYSPWMAGWIIEMKLLPVLNIPDPTPNSQSQSPATFATLLSTNSKETICLLLLTIAWPQTIDDHDPFWFLITPPYTNDPFAHHHEENNPGGSGYLQQITLI